MTIRNLLLGTAALALTGSAAARVLDPNVPADALESTKRTQCGAKDGSPAGYYWSGHIYSRVEGEPDQ